MNDDQFDDLKQFIDSRISQSEERITGDLTKKIEDEVSSLRQEMRDGFSGAGEALEPVHDQLADHEARLTKLEDAKAA